MAHVVDPALHTSVELCKIDASRTLGVEALSEPSRALYDFARLMRRCVRYTTKPSHGIRQATGATCAECA